MNKKTVFRSSNEWKKIRKKIINRDKHCLICGSTDHLEVHHIIPLDVNWELRKEKLNLITLCKSHHNLVHNGVFNQCYLTNLVGEINDMLGKKFGRLTVLEECKKRDKHKRIYYKCICECGNLTYVSGSNLRLGRIKSCGCLLDEAHGKSHTKLMHDLM